MPSGTRQLQLVEFVNVRIISPFDAVVEAGAHVAP
jgi:hypothetical protein